VKWWDQLRDTGVKESAFRSKVVEFYLLWPIRMHSRHWEEKILHLHTSQLSSWRAVKTQELLLKIGIPRFFSSFAMKHLGWVRWQFLPTLISREKFLEAGHRFSSPFLEKQLNGKKPFSEADREEPVPTFFAFCEIQIFTAVFIRDSRLFVSWARAIQFTFFYIPCSRFVLILYSRLCLIFKSSFPFRISDKQLC